MLVPLLKKVGLKFSLNDPGWGRNSQNNEKPPQQDGRKPDDGPPDLDQVWRDFNQRITRIFGNKKGGGGNGSGGGEGGSGGGFRPDAKGAGIGVGVVVAIAFFLWLASGFFIVQEGQTAVIMSFGKYSHTASPGFNWRWPAPIQSHEIVNVSQVRTVEVGYRSSIRNKQLSESLMLTEDENIIDIQFAVQYRLKKASDWVFNNRDQDSIVKEVAESSIREVVGHNKMDFVLYEGRAKVALDVNQLMQKILDRYGAGVQVTNVTMLAVQPPEQVQTAFDDAVRAGQDRERQKNEGQAYANDVIPRARGAASRLMQESEAYRSQIVANAEGEGSRFQQVLTEYQKAPGVTRDRLYLDTMQHIFSNTTKLMMDVKGGNNLIYLPLDKLISQTVPAESAQSSAATATTRPSPPATGSAEAARLKALEDTRTRESASDSRSSRDRETR